MQSDVEHNRMIPLIQGIVFDQVSSGIDDPPITGKMGIYRRFDMLFLERFVAPTQ
jgi:hypothetical protein